MITGATSTSSFYTNAADQLGALQGQIDAVNTAISSGSQISAASQDPVAAAQMRALQRQDAQAKVDTASANKASANLQLTDGAMTEMVNDLNQARMLVTQAATGTLSDANRASIGKQLAQIQGDMLSIANTRDANGHALFGGGVVGNAYAFNPDGSAAYTGSATAPTLPIGGGQSVAPTMIGPDVLAMTDGHGNSTDVISMLGALATALQAGGSGAQDAASTGLTSLANGLDAVTTAQTVIGSRESWIALVTQNETTAATSRATQESQIGSTDVSGAAIKLQELTTALQASQASFVRLSSLSLFSVIGH